ncbi:MAG: hypothetical protein IT445_08780 [Phycisphaeraceae bacterium]|nr:hypothetical protein [Phycisphaeraceae bacterium]
MMRTTITLISLLACAMPSSAVLIDFETTPTGVIPIDDAPLPSSLPYTFGGLQISFGFDTNTDGVVDSYAVFEQAGTYQGEPFSGFAGSVARDTADPGFTAQLGNWFLRGPVGGQDFGRFIIKYTSSFTVTDASGEIWDIDGNDITLVTEQYQVQAFDSGGNLLATVLSPIGTLSTPTAPLDGQPWVFTFSGLSAGIDRIEIDFVGTKPAGIGLAFNNFNPTAIPDPAGAWIIACALGSLLLRRHTGRSMRHYP